ncbi:mCG148016 [Mus musculus]|nr:mCG148016 [Mus musculus]
MLCVLEVKHQEQDKLVPMDTISTADHRHLGIDSESYFYSQGSLSHLLWNQRSLLARGLTAIQT